MMMNDKKRGLGRGLSALLGDLGDDDKNYVPEGESVAGGVKNISVSLLVPNPDQPRRVFDEEGIEDLATSIRTKGILTPVLVRPDPENRDRYQIIAGERRWRAAQRAQVHDIPVIVHELSDQETMEVALVENLQRQDLSPFEEAEGYRRLMSEFNHTQEGLAQAVGKSRSHIANMLRLTTLPDEVKNLVEEGKLSAGHARTLVTAPNPLELAHQIMDRGLNVRQAEKLAHAKETARSGKSRSTRTYPEKDADTLALERDVSNALGLTVQIENGVRGGIVSITYETLAQLDEVLRRLSSEPGK